MSDTKAISDINYFDEIHRFENLYNAYLESRKSKRWKNSTNGFEMNAIEYVLILQEKLESETYRIERYNEFTITSPKERTIRSLKFSDRVVQRSLCDNVIEPVLERSMIYDSYACRKGKGTHACLRRTEEFMRSQCRKHGDDFWILKCDIEKYFDSIDHDILKVMLYKKFGGDPKLLKLLFMIVDSTEGTGLPIGNQTSQWFSIYFLSAFDHFIKEVLKIKCYVRYMDDFVLMHHDKEYLKLCKREISAYLGILKLELNGKSHIFPAKNGIDFLGFHLYLTETGKVIKKVRRDSVKRMKRKIKKFKELYESGERTKEQITQSFESWVAHAKHGNTYYLIEDMTRRFEKIFEGDDASGKSYQHITNRSESEKSEH